MAKKLGEALDLEKITEEIKTLKLQRSIAVVTAIVAVISMLLTNIQIISRLWYDKPKLKLAVKSAFLGRVGSVRILDISGSLPKVVLTEPVQRLVDWETLEPGPYRFELSAGSLELSSSEFQLRLGERKVIEIINPKAGGINVVARNTTKRPHPGEPLGLEVDSSGNGFLWIFDGSDKIPQLIFPAAGMKNEIVASETFRFPHGYDITAGSRRGIESIIVVVTSTLNENYARRLAEPLGHPGKANLERILENWGLTSLEYQID